ncbi:phage portal protein [Mesorhizobium sp. J428]|uniref:phage portal protein n=1 Tax=Mesorhizobium sp. J428 TaxID=2898440 RepID=UPI00215178CF|nr:phage portal protein [Mesorhizobium sp. J428]MCR5856566.1 phage portal protein [Mesorhizobium sp. J428]
MRFRWPFLRTETKSLSSPTDEELLIFTGAVPSAGLISRTEAMTVPAIQRAIALISGSIASFDVLVEKLDGATWSRDTDHPTAKLLAGAPNDWQSTHELLRDLIATALTVDRGGIALANRVDGKVVELIRYEPTHTAVDYSTDGRLEPSFKINNSPISADDIVHLRGPFSRCPLSLALESATLLKALETQSRNLMRRGARPGGVISTQKSVGDTGAGKMLAGWRAAHEGPDAAGRTAILWDGATWSQLSLSAVDAQFIETWKFAILEVARHFGVPPQMLFDFDRATWSNAEQAGKEWLASLELWMRPLEASLRRALFSDEDRATYRIRFDRDDFTAVDLTARATAISSLISSRVLNPNEGRDWLGMPPRTGGEVFANPNTGSNQPGTAPPKSDDEDPTDDA